jgi:hypothetical protein
MQRVREHRVPGGPLAVRWLAYQPLRVQAGTRARWRIELENAGTAPWRGPKLSYHWLDERGNAIVWDGIRTDIPELGAADGLTIEAEVRAPIPPGRYRLAFDLVVEHRFWFAELGNEPLGLEVDVEPRDASAAVAHLPPDVEPAADWYERVRAAHEEGYSAVGGSLEGRRIPPELAPYAPGGGRNPAFAAPLVCPSLLAPLEPNDEVAGLPAWRPEGDEPWLYDGRIRARPRSGRPRG